MSVILATASYDHKIRFWEAPSGINSRTLRCPDSQVNCLEITPNKQFLAAGCNPQIRLFEINDTSNPNAVLSLEGHTSSVTSLGFQRDVRYLYSGSEDGTVKIFDLRSPTYSCSFDCKSPVNTVAHHPTRNEIVSGDQSGAVKVWDLNASKCINEIVPDAYTTATSTTTAMNDNMTSAQSSGSTSSSSTSIYKPLSSSTGERTSIQSVDISEDGRTCIAANNHSVVFMWDPSDSTNFRPLAKFRSHPTGTYLTKAKISPDCRQLVTCSSDQTAKLFDITRRDSSNGNSNSNSGNNNGNDTTNGNGNGNGNTAATNGGNSNSNSAAGGGGFTPSLTLTLSQHRKWVWDAVFSADSSYLVTASSDNVARLFNLRTGEVVRKYEGHQYAVTCVALNDSST